MPINWDTFDQQVDQAIVKSVDKTDGQLADKASAVTNISSEEIKTLFPDPPDVKKFIELMKVLKSSEDENIKLNRIMDEGMGLAKVAFKLLSKYAA